jgi:phosphohistidine swiveling domain-containing protein
MIKPKVDFSSFKIYQDDEKLNEEDKKKIFFIDKVHFPNPPSPIFYTSWIPALLEGIESANKKFFSEHIGKRYIYYRGYVYFYNIPSVINSQDRKERQKKAVMEAFDNLECKWNSYKDRITKILDEYKNKNYSDLSTKQIIEEFARYYKEIINIYKLHFQITVPIRVMGNIFVNEFTSLTGYSILDAFSYLNVESVPTIRIHKKLDGLVEELKIILPEIKEEIDENNLYLSLNGNKKAENFMTHFFEFIEKEGLMINGYADWSCALWKENKDVLIRIIYNTARSGKIVNKDNNHLDISNVLMRFGEKGKKCMGLFNKLSKVWKLNEEHNTLMDQETNAIMHLILKDLGIKLSKEKILSNLDDVFFLYFDELINLETLNTTKIKDNILLRRKLHNKYNQMSPPFWVGNKESFNKMNTDYVIRKYGVNLHQGFSDKIKGNPVSKGITEGYIKKVNNLNDFIDVDKNTIIVCKSVSPSFTSFFGIVGGIISESGGLLSHGALIAREMSIPAIFGVNGAYNSFNNGQQVSINGNNGIIKIVGKK